MISDTFSVPVLLKQDKECPRIGQAVAQLMPSGKFLVFIWEECG